MAIDFEKVFADRMGSQIHLFYDLLPKDWALREALIITLVVASPILVSWLITSKMASHAVEVTNGTASGLSRPPTMPYAVPFLGHVIQFMWNPNNFMSNAASYINRTVPVRIVLPMFSNYVVSGPESILAYFKESARDLSAMPRGIRIMEHVFGCPSNLLYLFEPPDLQKRAMTKEEDAMEHLLHHNVNAGLSSTQLDGLTARYQKYLIEQIEENSDNIGDDWVDFPDLDAFVAKHVLEAAVRPMFGTYVLSLNPTLADDFWDFNKYVGLLFMGMPRWMNPAAYRAREKMVQNIKRWHRHASEQCDAEKLGDVDWDPYYGSKFIRERLGLLTQRGILDEAARVAEMFAFLWVTNTNSVPATTWFLLETLRDTSLKTRVSACLPTAAVVPSIDSKSSLPTFDVDKLCSDTLLQSMYAETLRLRVAVVIMRQPTQEKYSFRGWHIKNSEALSVCTLTEQMNSEIWSTGSADNPHPLDTFWAERFIVDPSDPSSGPLKTQKHKKSAGGGKPYFSLDGLSGSWVPFGGGWGLCPGRHFTKREVMTTAAIFLTAYDMELVGEENRKQPGVDMSCFGFGTMPPDRKVAFRIRRRRV